MCTQLIASVVINMLADVSAQAVRKIKSKRWKSDFLVWEHLSVVRMGLWAIICTPIIETW